MNRDAIVVSRTGAPLVCVGKQYWRRFEAGQYHVSIEWDNESRACEPVMLIWRKAGGLNAGVFGVCLSSIGMYADPSGYPTPYAVRRVLAALPILGVLPLDTEVFSLIDVIIRHTPDLIACPLQPVSMRLEERGAPTLEVLTKLESGGNVTKHSEVKI